VIGAFVDNTTSLLRMFELGAVDLLDVDAALRVREAIEPPYCAGRWPSSAICTRRCSADDNHLQSVHACTTTHKQSKLSKLRLTSKQSAHWRCA
jgi:hypothetical protein